MKLHMAGSATLVKKTFLKGNSRLPSLLTWLWIVLWSLHEGKAFEVYSDTPIEDVVNASSGDTVLLSGEDEKLKAALVSWSFEGPNGREDIVDYYIGTSEAEIPAAYENRVIFSLHNFSLQLFNLSKNDSGRYTFKIDMSKTNRVIHLQVTDPLLGASILKQSTGECALVLHCKISGEASNIKWEKNGDLPEADILVINKTILIINGTGSALSGNYTCIAQNPFSTVRANYTLLQRDVPMEIVLAAVSASMASIFSLPALLNTLLISVSAYLLAKGLNLPAWLLTVCDFSSNFALMTSLIGWISWCFLDPHFLPVVVYLSIVSLLRLCSGIWQCWETQKLKCSQEENQRVNSGMIAAFQKKCETEYSQEENQSVNCGMISAFQKRCLPVYSIWNKTCHIVIFAFAVVLTVRSCYHDMNCRTFGTMRMSVYIWSFSISLITIAIITLSTYIKKKCDKKDEKSPADCSYHHVTPEENTDCAVSISK